jgi:two-component system chemotaxis response regulator CheB
MCRVQSAACNTDLIMQAETTTTADARDVRRGGASPRYELVVIAASRGGVQALSQILAGLPADFPLPIAIVLHRRPTLPNLLPQVLGRHTRLNVKLATSGEKLKEATVYLAPPDSHMLVTRQGTCELTDGRRIRPVLSSANPLFSSAARVLRGQVIAIVLTGGDSDATDGVQSVHNAGGLVIAQDRATSEDYSMPKSAIETGCVDRVLPLKDIAPTLISLVAPESTANGLLAPA